MKRNSREGEPLLGADSSRALSFSLSSFFCSSARNLRMTSIPVSSGHSSCLLARSLLTIRCIRLAGQRERGQVSARLAPPLVGGASSANGKSRCLSVCSARAHSHLHLLLQPPLGRSNAAVARLQWRTISDREQNGAWPAGFCVLAEQPASQPASQLVVDVRRLLSTKVGDPCSARASSRLGVAQSQHLAHLSQRSQLSIGWIVFLFSII